MLPAVFKYQLIIQHRRTAGATHWLLVHGAVRKRWVGLTLCRVVGRVEGDEERPAWRLFGLAIHTAGIGAGLVHRLAVDCKRNNIG